MLNNKSKQIFSSSTDQFSSSEETMSAHLQRRPKPNLRRMKSLVFDKYLLLLSVKLNYNYVKNLNKIKICIESSVF